jgi:hypothetical protein
MLDSCKDCANFEDRRNIEGIALCANNRGPGVSCPQFKPLEKVRDAEIVDWGFCIECKNFQVIQGKPLCANRNYPGVTCEMFEPKV